MLASVRDTPEIPPCINEMFHLFGTRCVPGASTNGCLACHAGPDARTVPRFPRGTTRIQDNSLGARRAWRHGGFSVRQQPSGSRRTRPAASNGRRFRLDDPADRTPVAPAAIRWLADRPPCLRLDGRDPCRRRSIDPRPSPRQRGQRGHRCHRCRTPWRQQPSGKKGDARLSRRSGLGRYRTRRHVHLAPHTRSRSRDHG